MSAYALDHAARADVDELASLLADLTAAGEGGDVEEPYELVEDEITEAEYETARRAAGYANRLARATGREVPYPRLDPSWWPTAAEREKQTKGEE